jgi:hypothetical protein
MIRQYWNNLRLQLADLKLPEIKDRFVALREPKVFESFAVLCCFDQHLVLSSIKANQSMMLVDDCLSIDLPAHLIGNSGVENYSEVSQIILDMMDVMGLTSSPVLLLISSSKFSHFSFPVDQISSWNLSDAKLRSKSPFLADQTLIDLYPNDFSTTDDQLIRGVSYANAQLVHSWVNVLRIVGKPVLGISPLYDGLLNWLFSTSNSLENTIVCDVEPSSCNLLIKYSLFGSQSFQLPFGTSLYSGQSSRFVDEFFKRLQSSLDVIKSDHGLTENMSCIISGYGLGDLGPSLMSNLGNWSLLGDATKESLQLSNNLKPDELSLHQYLFPQLSLCLAAYLQS